METLIIQSQSKSTAKLLMELAKKLGEKVSILDRDIAEDFAFGEMMKSQKTGNLVSKEAILSELSK